MNKKLSKNSSSSSSSTPSSSSTVESTISLITLTLNEDCSIINLIPCEYDPIDGYGSPSEDSIDSSEVIDSSDDELEVIKINEFYKIKEQ